MRCSNKVWVDRISGFRGFLLGLLGGLVLLLGSAPGVEAQYFGRNKVQYDDFDFEVLKTASFRHPLLPRVGSCHRGRFSGWRAVVRAIRPVLPARVRRSKPLVFYADHPDFQQTNTLQSFLGESTGGVTESLKNRVIMPMAGSYQDTDHVLGPRVGPRLPVQHRPVPEGPGVRGPRGFLSGWSRGWRSTCRWAGKIPSPPCGFGMRSGETTSPPSSR